MTQATVLYVVNNLYAKQYGGRLFTKQVDDLADDWVLFHGPYKIGYVSDYIIKFSGGKHHYLKNRSGDREPYNEKQLAWMLLRAKTYGST